MQKAWKLKRKKKKILVIIFQNILKYMTRALVLNIILAKKVSPSYGYWVDGEVQIDQMW